MQSAWKVGLFVIGFVVLVVVGYSLIGASLFRKPKDVYYGEFSDASGIEKGAIITMAGVRVGEVRAVELRGPGSARMTIEVAKGTFIPRDAMLVIPTGLFSIGEQRVDIVSAEGEKAGRLEVGGTMRGIKASVLQTLLPEGDKTLSALNDNLVAIREILGDENFRARLNTILATTEASIRQVGLAMSDARGLIAENRATLRQALGNAALAVEDLRRGISAFSELVGDPELKPQLTEMLATISQTAKRADQMVAELGELVSDPSLRQALDNTLKNIEEMSKTGSRIAENAEKITADGAVVSQKAIVLADEAQEIATEAKKLLAKISDFVDKLPQDIRVPLPRFQLEVGRNLRGDAFQTDLSVHYPLTPSNFVFAGVYDATESNLLTLQYGSHMRYGDLRYGVYASKPGIGVDWRPFQGVLMSGDLFDLNHPQLDVRARINLERDWYAYLGLTDLFGRTQPLVGVGVRR